MDTTKNAGRHLLAADDALDEARRWGDMALCGAVLPAGVLPPAECPPGRERTDCLLFCPACVAEAAGRNAVLLAGAARS